MTMNACIIIITQSLERERERGVCQKEVGFSSRPVEQRDRDIEKERERERKLRMHGRCRDIQEV